MVSTRRHHCVQHMDRTFFEPDTFFNSSNSTTTATAWIKGGVNGQVYQVVNRITTASIPARVEDRTIQITMQQK